MYHKGSIRAAVEDSLPRSAIEFDRRDIENMRSFGEALLAVVAAAGLIAVTAVAPNALQALKLFEKKRRKRMSRHERVQAVTRTFYYLKRMGYVSLDKEGTGSVSVTERGKEKIDAMRLRLLRIEKTKTWDGRYWQIAADIPNEYRMAAAAFRKKVKGMGCFPLQRTLWFYPFDPRSEVEAIAHAYGVERFVTVMKIEVMDPADADVLRSHFAKQKVL